MGQLTMASLFDGAGTWPLAATMNGIKPFWSSEIEKFPCQVTEKRFPDMRNYGDICGINGAEVPPVDVITFGSPCQDLSIAGKRAGMDGERSSLFYQVIRIIKEMKEKTNGRYPTFGIWENVCGAYSSNKGEDFRSVLEELANVSGKEISIPRPAKWQRSGCVNADGWSIAWRTLDAQYWGVPQRRRRIFLVADFAGQRAGKILFEREGLQRHFAESSQSWKEAPGDTGDGVKKASAHFDGYNGSVGNVASSIGINCGMSTGRNGIMEAKAFKADQCTLEDVAPTIVGDHNNRVSDMTTLVMAVDQGARKSQCNVSENIAPTMACTHGGEPVICVRERCGKPGGGKGCLIQTEKTGAIATSNDQFVCYAMSNGQTNSEILNNRAPTLNCNHDNGPFVVYNWIVRRLTPTECARLQGMPDWWCADVPHADTVEYKMWGNGMALPNALYVMEGIKEASL